MKKIYLTFHVQSQKLGAITEQSRKLLTRNNAEFGMIRSGLNRLSTSQSAEHEAQTKSLTRMEGQLLELQDQLKSEIVSMPRRSFPRTVRTRTNQFLYIYQKRQTYHLPFGKLVTGRPIFGRWSDEFQTRHCTFTFIPPHGYPVLSFTGKSNFTRPPVACRV